MHQAQNQRNHWSWWSCVELLVLVFYILVPAAASLPELSPNRTETCQFETHNITCPYNHMILLMSAEFGRMHDGRCIQHPTNMGCKEDVLAFMDKQCGGQRSCRMEVSVLRKKNFNPCVEMESYLETTHVCVPLQSAPHCGSTLGIQGRQSSGYLAPSPRQGQCAWTLQANPGQRINITLYDFEARSATRSAAHSSGSTICPRYATISEGSSSSSSSSRHRQEHPICGGNARVQSVFVSDGSQIDLTMFGSTSHHFLLHYEAIGCSRIAHPANSIVHYSENSMTITCNATHEKWYLTCRGNQWVGQIHNCTAVDKSDIWTTLANDWSTPHGVLLVVGIGVTLGVLFGAVLLTCVVLATKRYRGLCQCFPLHDPAKMSAHNHQPMIMSQHNHPITGKPTDHMMFDHAPSSAHAYQQQRSWLSQRPLPDPELEPSEMGMRQGADVLALCKDAPHDLVMEGTVGGVGRGLFDPLEVDPALEAYGASQAGVLVGPGEPGERYIDTSAPVMRYEHYPLPAGAIPVSYGPTVDVGGGTTVRTCYIAGNNAHLYETPGIGNRSELV